MIPRILIATTCVLLLPATACSQAETPPAAAIETASGELIIRDRSAAGSASLHQGREGVVIRIEADDLPQDARNQWHGVHLHSIGDCSSEDFTSSAGHINPSGRQHGLLNPEGPDNADLPNIWVDGDGSIRAEVYTTRVSLNGSDALPALLDEDGSALVIHAGSDDQTSQPIGGAGARIACAVITAT
ncbi:superoxide dismutase family protein [Maricaulis salignorans]|uniref:Superoxide dismutase [Cu-Zn] n=1 Tax=Maricaulis salignorans TaxID=144026 RepID=A0A1G9PUJ5_9PROT|nr:superoxide dismutase family protein [Maricaulis salignorans]SDM01917.1 superoxide dismutase, Cu-Zn family [Maricaulis salignorans]